MSARRVGNWIQVGDSADKANRWGFPDPSLASAGECASTLNYLLLVCPSTEDALSKLRQMRKALREVGEPPKEEEGGR